MNNVPDGPKKKRKKKEQEILFAGKRYHCTHDEDGRWTVYDGITPVCTLDMAGRIASVGLEKVWAEFIVNGMNQQVL